jgi:monoamine oxidase
MDDAIVVGGGIAGLIAARDLPAAEVFDRIAAPHGRLLVAGSDVASELTGWPAPVVSGRAAAREALGRLA